MTDTKEYNGWTNYATWRVNLEMLDGIDPRDMDWHRMEIYDLSEAIKAYCEEILEMEINHKGNSLVLSYALAFLDDVNWREIARHMLEEYAEENA